MKQLFNVEIGSSEGGVDSAFSLGPSEMKLLVKETKFYEIMFGKKVSCNIKKRTPISWDLLK